MNKKPLNCLIVMTFLMSACFTGCASSQSGGYTTTEWIVEPNVALDALCFIAIMTGDPYYLEYYNSEYLRFKPLLTPEAEQSLANLQEIHLKYGLLLGSNLVEVFYYSNPQTLDDLLAALDSPDVAFRPENLEISRDDYRWELFLSLIPDLKVIISWMKAAGFASDWEAYYLPELGAKADSLKTELSKYNLIPLMQKYLHETLPYGNFIIILSHYCLPYGINLDKNAALLYPSQPTNAIVDTTIHESLHSLVEGRAQNPELWDALSFVENDEFYMGHFRAHDPSFGYNELDEYIEEDIVEALDQLLAEKAGVAQDPVERWNAAPAHLQILTPLVYSLLKQENFDQGNETFQEFLIRMIQEGKLKAGMIESGRSDFFAGVN